MFEHDPVMFIPGLPETSFLFSELAGLQVEFQVLETIAYTVLIGITGRLHAPNPGLNQPRLLKHPFIQQNRRETLLCIGS